MIEYIIIGMSIILFIIISKIFLERKEKRDVFKQIKYYTYLKDCLKDENNERHGKLICIQEEIRRMEEAIKNKIIKREGGKE